MLHWKEAAYKKLHIDNGVYKARRLDHKPTGFFIVKSPHTLDPRDYKIV